LLNIFLKNKFNCSIIVNAVIIWTKFTRK
jgi:hypothetical protein